MPEPTPGQGHVDQLLTTVSVAYMQSAGGYVADKVFPVVPVAHASDFYLIYPKGSFYRDDVGIRPLGGESRRTGYQVDHKPYLCEEHGIQGVIDDRERANATPPHDPERAKVKLLTQQQLIHRDRLWAASYFKTGVWTTDLTGVSSAPSTNQFLQLDQAGTDPVLFFDLYRDQFAQAAGFEPNVVVLGRNAFRVIKNNPVVKDAIKYTERAIVTTDLLASLWEIDRVVRPGAVINTGPEGGTDAYSFIVSPNDILLAYAAPEPGLEVPSAGYIFSWQGLLGENAFVPAAAWRGRDERAHSDWFEVRVAIDPHVVAADLGVYFHNAVSGSV